MIKAPLVAAHRAGNSVKAYAEALRCGADVIELDVHMTKDRHLVVHSFPMVYVADCPVPICSLDLRDIQLANESCFQGEDEGVLLLEQVLDRIKADGKRVLIDVKNGPFYYTSIHEDLGRLIFESGLRGAASVLSYDHVCIHAIKEEYGEAVSAGILYAARLLRTAEIVRMVGADFIETQTRFLTDDVLQAARENDFGIVGWCSNDPDEIRHLATLEVDMITTDDVLLAKSALNEWIGDRSRARGDEPRGTADACRQ